MSGLITDVAEDRPEANDTYNWHYEYDNLKRLELAEQTAPDSSVLDYVYSYDRNGNRLSKSIGGTATNYTYNSLDQLLNESGASSKTYAWDGMGRMTTDGDRAFEWSVDDRLLKVNIASPAATITYSYDHLGTRVGRNAPGEDDPDKHFLTDYQNPTGYSQTLSEVNNEGVANHNYWWGSDHAPLAQSFLNPEDPNFDIAFFHGDNLGTTRALTSRTGINTTDSFYTYTPFGEVTTPPGGSSLTNYYFTGQHKDAATDLQYHRARWLSTPTGGWISEDAIFDFPGNFGNRYGYSGLNPVSSLDLSGLYSIGEVVVVAAIVGSLSGLSLGIENVLDNDDETTFLGGFAEGFIFGFLAVLLVVLIAAAVTVFAPGLTVALWLYVAANIAIIGKVFFALGLIAAGWGVWDAISKEEYKVATWRAVQSIFGLSALTSRGRAIARGVWRPIRNHFAANQSTVVTRSIADDLAARASKQLTFRCDHFIDPDVAFARGISSKGTRRDLRSHVIDEADDTDFVSTSWSDEIALRRFGNKESTRMYVIESRRGIDANEVLDYDGGVPNPFDYEMEVSIPGGVRPEEIRGYFPVSNGKIVGDFVPNPNYDPHS